MVHRVISFPLISGDQEPGTSVISIPEQNYKKKKKALGELREAE